MKPLSTKLAELSVEARNTEDRANKAQNEVRERIEQQRDEARARAEQALATVNQRVNEVKGEARTRFNTLQAKVDADFENMKQQAAEKRHKFEAWQANNYADDKQADALAAIDYAIAATKMAELQTLDAIVARADADSRSEQIQQPQPTLA